MDTVFTGDSLGQCDYFWIIFTFAALINIKAKSALLTEAPKLVQLVAELAIASVVGNHFTTGIAHQITDVDAGEVAHR
ncbi:hypothetical protein D3C76_1803100 [compost metagenome]